MAIVLSAGVQLKHKMKTILLRSYVKVFRLRMIEIISADARSWRHGKIFGELHPYSFFDIEQFPDF